MLAITDYIGLGTLITTIGTTLVAIIVALQNRTTHKAVAQVSDQVTTENGTTLAALAENDALTKLAEAAPPVAPAPDLPPR